MSDIVIRLGSYRQADAVRACPHQVLHTINEAADEIERLRASLTEARRHSNAAEAWRDAVQAAFNPLRQHDPAQMLGRDLADPQVVVDQVAAFRAKLAESQQREAWWRELESLVLSLDLNEEEWNNRNHRRKELRRLLGLEDKK